MVPFDLRLVLACCCSQNFCNSLHARILVNGKTGNIGETCTRCEYFRKHISLGFADALKNSWRMVKAPTKVESNLETWKHEEYYYYYCSVLRWVLARLLGAKKKKIPFNKREIPANGKLTKCSLLARQILSLLVLAKINALLARPQILAKTMVSIPL